MTSPAPAAAPAPSAGTDTDTADTALVAALATGLATALAPAALLQMTLSYCRSSRIQPASMLAVIQVVMSFPPEKTGVAGSASLITARQNMLRRAQFTVAVAHRVTHDMIEARSQGTPLSQALTESVARERRYFGQHLDAMWNRAKAASQVDSAAMSYGDLLGWNTVRDSRTSAECRAADGKNFYASAQPLIGWPGAVHPHCRCYPGPARIGARMLPSVQRVPVRARLMV